MRRWIDYRESVMQNRPHVAKCEVNQSRARVKSNESPRGRENGMTPISRRDVLAGLAASSAASIVTARSEQRQRSAAGNAALLSADERGQHADALLRYFAANAPQLLRAPDGILKHPSVAPACQAKRIQRTFGIGTRFGPARDSFDSRRCFMTISLNRSCASTSPEVS